MKRRKKYTKGWVKGYRRRGNVEEKEQARGGKRWEEGKREEKR